MAKARITFDISNPDAPVFVISVAAELTGMHPQTLRGYDRMGLVSPGRTGGGGRRYSLRDIELLRVVAELTASGIGIEGVRRILELENQVLALRRAWPSSRPRSSPPPMPALPEPARPTPTAEVTRFAAGVLRPTDTD